MTDREDLILIILSRFEQVPNFDRSTAEDLIGEAIVIHGENASTDLVLLYAQYQGAMKIAMGAAYFFSFSDGEHSVDKSSIFDNYRKISNTYKEMYDKEAAKYAGNNFRVMTRMDRPITTPLTGDSGRRSLWRRY